MSRHPGGFVRKGADDETGGEGGLEAGVKKGGPMHEGQRPHEGSGGWPRSSQHGGKPSDGSVTGAVPEASWSAVRIARA